MAKFRENCPSIVKTKKAHNSKYAGLAETISQIKGVESECGLSHSWRTDSKNKTVEVTCIVTHELGHSEQTTLFAEPDKSGSKNSIQAIGSSVTYLQRYTLFSLLGLASIEDDLDGGEIPFNGDVTLAIQEASSKEVLRSIWNSLSDKQKAEHRAKMSDSEYFSIKAASCSLLKRLDCPAKALIPFKPTPAMQMGTLVHCAVLEPEEFDLRYIAAPKINKRTKAGKEEWAAFVEDNKNKTVITLEDYDTSHYIAKCVMANPIASRLLSTGADCKAKADYVKDKMVVDLKTAADSSPEGFSRACANFGYHMQDAHYSNGSECERFVFVVVETTYPFIVSVYELDSEAKDIGKREVEDKMNKYVELNMFDAWDDGYVDNQTVTTLSLPNWCK